MVEFGKDIAGNLMMNGRTGATIIIEADSKFFEDILIHGVKFVHDVLWFLHPAARPLS